jgi:predicted sugar kinase
MNKFNFGEAGGGNLGFAVSAFTDVEISPSNTDEVTAEDGTPWNDERRVLVSYVVDRWRSTRNLRGRYRVSVHRVNRAHIGLASSASLQLATWSALAFLHDAFSPEQIRSEIAATYREAVAGSLQPGFTTGLSSFLGIFGGFAVIEPTLKPRVHVTVPRWTAAVVIPIGAHALGFGDQEIETLTGLAAKLDLAAAATKDAIITEVLIPAVTSADLSQIGTAIAELQSIGSKVAEIGLYGTRVASLLEQLRAEFECVFMSAVGPGIVVLTLRSQVDLEVSLRRFEVSPMWKGYVDDVGLTFAPPAPPQAR